MNPPPNPREAEARAAMREAIRPLLVNPTFDYYLTWPAQQAGVCCIAEQWRRNESGDIEAWYTAAQLRAALAAMQAAQTIGGHDERMEV